MGKESDLLNAVHTKNAAQVQKILSKYCTKGKAKKLNLNHQDIDGLTVLHHAVFSAQHNVVQLLLEHCAGPSSSQSTTSSSSSATPSGASRSTAAVSMSSCLGVSTSTNATSTGPPVIATSGHLHPDLADTRGRRPFHFACASHSPQTLEMAERLLASGCSPGMADCEGNTPLHVASANLVHGAALLRLLLRAAPTLDCIVYNHHALTPLDIACDVGNVRVVDLLTGVEPVRRFIQSMSHTPPRKGGPQLTSCLHMAAANGHLDVLRTIFTHVPYVNINHTTLQGTCLHVAALASQWNVLLYLLQCGVDPNALNAREQLASDLVNVNHAGGREVKHLLQELCAATQVQAIKEYKGSTVPTNMDPRVHITFRERDLITVLNRSPDGMWKGFVTSQGLLHTGYFPSSYVAPLSVTPNSSNVPVVPTQNQPPPLVVVSGNNKPPNHLTLHTSCQPFSGGTTACDWWQQQHQYHPQQPSSSSLIPCQNSPDSAVVDCSSPAGGVLDGGGNGNAVAAALASLMPMYSGCHGIYSSGDCDGTVTGGVTGIGLGQGSSSCGSNRNSSSADSVDSGRGSVHTLHHMLMSINNPHISHTNTDELSTQLGRTSLTQQTAAPIPPAPSGLMQQKSAPGGAMNTTASSHSGSCTSLGRSSLGSGEEVTFPGPSTLLQVGRETALRMTAAQQEAHLAQVLAELQLDAYVPCFQQAGYAEDLNIVSRMTPEDLTAIGVTHPRHRKMIKHAVSALHWPDTLPADWPGSVEEWLRLLKLPQYTRLFQEQRLSTLEQLAHVTWEDLEEIGVTKLGHQKKLLQAVERLKRCNSRTGSEPAPLPPPSFDAPGVPPTPPRRTSSGSLYSPKSLPRGGCKEETSLWSSRYLSPAASRRRRSGGGATYENLGEENGVAPLPPLPSSFVLAGGETEFCGRSSSTGSSCSVHTSTESPNSTLYSRLPFANENCGTIRLNQHIPHFGSSEATAVLGGCFSSPQHQARILHSSSSSQSSSQQQHPPPPTMPPAMPQLPYDAAYRRTCQSTTVRKTAAVEPQQTGPPPHAMAQLHNNLLSRAAARVRLPNLEDDSSSTSGEMDGIRDALDDLQGSLERAGGSNSSSNAHLAAYAHLHSSK